MKTRTKIICTMGPAVSSVECMTQLIATGMDVARVNLSHGSIEEHIETINKLKEARSNCQSPMAIMIDTKGPEIRLGDTPEGGIKVKPKGRLRVCSEPKVISDEAISIRPAMVLDFLTVGTPVLIDNGYLQAKVVEKFDHEVVLEFENGGVITSSKGVNIPSIRLSLPALTQKDIDDIRLSLHSGAEIIAASFIRNADNVLEIKQYLHSLSFPDVLVLAKIESMEGVQNFESILNVADGIMVARGDLGVEVPLSQVPRLQKMMIRTCNLMGKPVVTATQMLESMIHNPRPTRAEVSDVANAIYDGTSAVMLSGETAIGSYPIQTVQIMGSIIAEAERDFDYREFFEGHARKTYHDVPSAVTLAGVKTAYSLGAHALFVPTSSGSTARLLSRLKPSMPIIALTKTEHVYHQLALSWGVTPILCHEISESMEDAFSYLSKISLQAGYVSYGDLVVLIAGWPFWVSGTSNTIRVDSLGHVIAKGDFGTGSLVKGRIVFVSSASLLAGNDLHDAIIVLTTYETDLYSVIQRCSGIILQKKVDNFDQAEKLKAVCDQYQKTAIFGVEDVVKSFKEGQHVTLDPEKAIVYSGLDI